MWIVEKSILLLNAALLGSFLLTNVECRSLKYIPHDKVSLAANTVGPFNNPTETYPVRFEMVPFASSWDICDKICQVSDVEIFSLSQFYSLPFCEGTGKQKRHKQDLGETLSGSHKVTTPYDITFLDAVSWRSLCSVNMDKKDVSEITLDCVKETWTDSNHVMQLVTGLHHNPVNSRATATISNYRGIIRQLPSLRD